VPEPVRPTAVVYVDGHNLYKVRLAQNPELRWLNLLAMFENMFPDLEVVKVHYFSAELLGHYSSTDKKVSRQKMYFRALATLSPKLEIHLGAFRADTRLLPVSPLKMNAESNSFERTPVVKFEEKGSDVHLASRLVADSATRSYAIGILLSNDSDFAPAVKIACQEFKAELYLVVPQLEVKRASNQLKRSGFQKVLTIDERHLKESQFDQELKDSQGLFHRPKKWA